MKKLPIFVGMALGAVIGFFTAIHDDIEVKIVAMTIWIFVGVAIGGAISRIGKKGKFLRSDEDALAGLGVTPDDLMKNYWRDKGRTPLSNPLEPERGHHQFDPGHF